MSLSYPSDLAVNPRPPLPADLAYAAALAGVAERLGDAADLDELWPRLTEESLALIPADGVVVVGRRKRTWSLLAVRSGDGTTSVDQAEGVVAAADRQGLLTGAGAMVDGARATLATPSVAASFLPHELDELRSRGVELRLGAAVAEVKPDRVVLTDGWLSVLVVPLDRRPSREATRLLWFTGGPVGLDAYPDLADLLGRHAGAAARDVNSRVSLGHAVEARNRVGQAQGILMARYRITAEQAFAVLLRRSQDTNTKLRQLADDVILTGHLDGSGEAVAG